MKRLSPKRVYLPAALPWLAGLVGAAVFLRPLFAAPGSTILERVFNYDAFVNLGDLGALHRHLSQGPHGNPYDWLYAARFFFPQPRALLVSELMPLAALVTWPLGTHVVLAHNLLLFAACVLNTVAGFSFARSLGARPWASTIAGLAFAFGAYPNFESGRLQLLFLFPIAFACASTFRFARDGKTRDAVLAATWVLAQALLCLYYAMFLALSLPVVALAARVSNRRAGAARDLVRLFGAFAATLVPAAALLWPYTTLHRKLGLTRTLWDLFQQSGDLRFFLWADANTLPGRVLVDRFKWDTAYYPGAVALLATAVLLFWWVKRDVRRRSPVVGLLLLGAALSPWLTVSAFFASLLAAAAWLVWLARRGRTSFLAPALFALAGSGLFIFGGPTPTVFGHGLGYSPYVWLFQHVPFVDSMRMVRRAGLLVDLALCGSGAVLISRLEARVPSLAMALAALTLVEGVPFGVRARPVPTTCSDAAYAAAHRLGITAVADLSSERPRDPTLAERRYAALTCGVRTTDGPAGFVPALAQVAEDSARTLPDAGAQAWLWDAGLRGVVVRGQSLWSRDTVARLAPIARKIVWAGADTVVELSPPRSAAAVLPGRLAGPRIKVTGIECHPSPGCAAAIDGDEATRWTTFAQVAPGQSVTLRFAPAVVTGVEWHTTGHPDDFPRGLTVEREVAPRVWAVWRDVPSISPLRLGREAMRSSYAIALPPERTAAVRLIETGASVKFWLSATEIEVVGTATKQRSAPTPARQRPSG